MISLILALAIPGTAAGGWLHRGSCEIKQDPGVEPLGPLNVCVKGSVGTWFVHKSNTYDQVQPSVMHHAAGDIAIFITPWVSVGASGHSSIYVERDTSRVLGKDTARDELFVQLGNNALSRHRLTAGRGKPLYRLDHQLRREFFYAWNLSNFEPPEVDYVTYVYDNQLDLTLSTTYGQLRDPTVEGEKKVFGSARLMYDFAALEGTRLVVGGYQDGLLRRAVSLGMININGRSEQTSVELTRQFTRQPFNPGDFRQNFRLAYLSSEQDHFQYRFQYDDFFRFIRVGGVGVIYRPLSLFFIEMDVGFAKHEDNPKRSHWYFASSGGLRL